MLSWQLRGATKIISTAFRFIVFSLLLLLAGIVVFSIYFISLGGTATNFYSSSSPKSISFQLRFLYFFHFPYMYLLFFFFEMFSKLLVIPDPKHKPPTPPLSRSDNFPRCHKNSKVCAMCAVYFRCKYLGFVAGAMNGHYR